MRIVIVAILATLLLPRGALALSDAQKVSIAQELSKTYPAISVTVESQPIISGDKDPVLFRISPSGQANFGNLFLKGRYDIIHKPDDPDVLGSYLCTMADEFVRERRNQNAGFLPGIKLSASAGARGVSFEISGDATTVQAIIYGILRLWDFLRDDYGKFDIFVRGYADQGQNFKKLLLARYPYHDVAFFPLVTPKDPLLAAYFRKTVSRHIGDTYTNSDLPELRATFLKQVIDIFLKDCSLNGHLTSQSVVLEGGVIPQNQPKYRTIDLYFYAHQ